MGRVTRFRKRRRRNPTRAWRRFGPFAKVFAIGALVVAGYFGFLAFQTETAQDISFDMCGRPPHNNCVIDGDTFYLRNQSIRIADIDAPETNPPRCVHEADLGAKATRRLLALINEGPFEVRPISGRDADRYGRKLRTLHRGGQSLGDVLVSEGLARAWTGRRMPWCD
jgi:micrococcal nuclease